MTRRPWFLICVTILLVRVAAVGCDDDGATTAEDVLADTTAPADTTDTSEPDSSAPPDVSSDEPIACEGGAACEVSASRDCAALAACSGDLDETACAACQGTPCGQDPACDGQYPCVEGVIVLQGCCSDAECEGLTPFCGRFIGTNNVCVNDDDV